MDTRQFLDTVLGNEGFYCTVGIKNGVKAKFSETKEDALACIEAADKNDEDVYVALATFNTEKREKNNVKQLKTLFLDIDCGEGKDYPTKTEAYTALKEFTKRYTLPNPSVIVDSGRGWHVYWVLDKPCGKDEWLPVAEQLKRTCKHAGFKVDVQVTADAARILRVPDTRNHKTSPPLDCTVYSHNDGVISLEEFSSKLPDDLIPVLAIQEFSEEDQEDMQNALGQKVIKRFEVLLEKTVNGQGCAQIDRAIRDPDSISYSLWTHVISIAKFSDIDISEARGMENVHAISSGYTDYSEDETNNVARTIEAPHSCARFEEEYPEGCEGCPHKDNDRFKSPISLAIVPNEASEESYTVEVPQDSEFGLDTQNIEDKPSTVTIPKYPKPYFRYEGGGIGYREIKDGNAEIREILSTDLYIIRKLRDRVAGTSFIFRHHTKRHGIRDFMIAAHKLVGRETFKVEMTKRGVFTMKPTLLMDFVAALVEHAEETMDEHTVADQFGWTENKKSFILGDREIFADEIRPNYPSATTENYFVHFDKAGSLEEWKKVPEFLDRDGFEPHQYMFGMSFGAPLMVFAPKIAGSIFHLKSSESGYGKSTGQFAGASVWGNPSLVVQKGEDTFASVWKVTETYKNIVVYLDELSNKAGKDLSDFAYAVSSGMQRNRLRGNSGETVERYRGKPWATLVPTSGNTGILDTISADYRQNPKGEAQRLLEEEARVKLEEDAETTREGIALNRLLEDNYGWAGELYIQKLVKHQKTAEALLLKTVNKLIDRTGLTAQNRFWLWQAAAVLTGLSIAQRMGLHNLNMAKLEDWVCNMLQRARRDTAAAVFDIRDILAQYFAENNRSIIRVNSAQNEIVDPEMEVYIREHDKPMYKIIGRVEVDTDIAYMLPTPFKKWCGSRKLEYTHMRRLIVEDLQGVDVKYRLSTGITGLNLPPTYLLKLNWSEDKPVQPVDSDDI
jgi:hypothetical protein